MKCCNPNCTETAIFGFVGMQKTKCAIHKEDGMNDYNLRECAWDSCTTTKPRWYRLGEEKLRKYCSKCRMNDHTIIHNPKITICNVDAKIKTITKHWNNYQTLEQLPNIGTITKIDFFI